jgi:hypothetical protein
VRILLHSEKGIPEFLTDPLKRKTGRARNPGCMIDASAWKISLRLSVSGFNFK